MSEAAKHTPKLPLSVGHSHGYGQLNGVQVKDGRGLVAAVSIGDVPELAPFELADLIVRAVNCHADMLAALKAVDDDWTSTFPGGPEGSREWAGGLGTLSDDTVERWRAIRAAIARAESTLPADRKE